MAWRYLGTGCKIGEPRGAFVCIFPFKTEWSHYCLHQDEENNPQTWQCNGKRAEKYKWSNIFSLSLAIEGMFILMKGYLYLVTVYPVNGNQCWNTYGSFFLSFLFFTLRLRHAPYKMQVAPREPNPIMGQSSPFALKKQNHSQLEQQKAFFFNGVLILY